MPSTYSALKIQLMATGENNTTWGDVTNTNLGTAIEEAIAGSADVAFSNANVTLTLTDTNATQTARNMRLNLTGTATTGYNLIVPAIEKAYIVNNGTDGTITVKNSTGTGIAVPAGKTMWVYNNGTNVVDAVNTLTSLTLGSPLGAVSGGTGINAVGTNGNVLTSNGTAWVSQALPASVGYPGAGIANSTGSAWGTSYTTTGSGTVVALATSPSFTTPTLGVASATSINKVAFTAPATGSTLTIADGKTLTANNSITLAGTDSTTMTFPSSSATVAGLGITQTFTGTQSFTGSTSILAAVLTNAAEVATVSATAATGTINYDVSTQSVLYYTSNASANWTLNIRHSSGTSMNTAMSTGQAVTIAHLVTQGATAYYNSAVQVDGNAITPKWQGGSAPTAGNASSIDVYTYTVVKTGSAAFTVFASQTQFK